MTALIAYALRHILPSSDALPGLDDMDLRALLRRYRSETAPLMWLGACMSALVFVFIGPALTLWIPLPMFFLSQRQRAEHTRRSVAHGFYLYRQSTFILKLVAGMLWGLDPRVREALDLPVYGPDPGTFRSV